MLSALWIQELQIETLRNDYVVVATTQASEHAHQLVVQKKQM